MGRKIDIRLMKWADAQQKVLNGEIDAITTMAITEKRKESYDFSDITLKYQYSIFARTDQVGIQTVADLEGKTVGVTKGGLLKQVLESNPKIKLVIIEDYLQGFRLLLSQEIDAVGADRWVGAYTLQKNSIRGITIRGEPFAERVAGIAVKKGNTELLNEIYLGIGKLKNDGTIKSDRCALRGSGSVLRLWSQAQGMGPLLHQGIFCGPFARSGGSLLHEWGRPEEGSTLTTQAAPRLREGLPECTEELIDPVHVRVCPSRIIACGRSRHHLHRESVDGKELSSKHSLHLILGLHAVEECQSCIHEGCIIFTGRQQRSDLP